MVSYCSCTLTLSFPFFSHPHRQTVMHYCAAQNFVEFIHDLADMGAPIDTLDERGR